MQLRVAAAVGVALSLVAARAEASVALNAQRIVADPIPAPADGGNTNGAIADPVVPAPADGGNYNGAIPYNNGPVVANGVNVVVVFWGPRVDSTTVAKIGGFYSALVNGPFVHALNEYSATNQTIGAFGSVTVPPPITPINTKTTLSKSDIANELSAQIMNGSLPFPTAAVFMVHLPPGITATLLNPDGTTQTSCVDFCGYHDQGPIQFPCGDGQSCSGIAHFGVMPDETQGGCAPVSDPTGRPTSGCGDRSVFEDLTAAASHELMEAITDPEPFTGWAQTLSVSRVIGEIGDPCNFAMTGDAAFTITYDASGTAWTAQRLFSNEAYAASGQRNGCIDYPTTACCIASAQCTWVRSGQSCPLPGVSDVMLTIPLPNGLGTPNVTLQPFFDGATHHVGPLCYEPSGASQPSWCVTVTGVTPSGPVTATLASNYTNPSGVLSCTTPAQCTPLPYTTSPSGVRVFTLPVGSADPPPAPAMPRAAVGVCCALLLMIGCFSPLAGGHARRRTG
jgi:hypothetical protein